MAKTSVRLSPEICRKLENEARRRSEIEGETVTVSELIRACIGEKFPQVCARARSERAGFCELQETVAGLGKRAESLEAHIDSTGENPRRNPAVVGDQGAGRHPHRCDCGGAERE